MVSGLSLLASLVLLPLVCRGLLPYQGMALNTCIIEGAAQICCLLMQQFLKSQCFAYASVFHMISLDKTYPFL